ncbi:MFS transporter [Prosthecobacter fluviatilis]|uniref:MFS transporter n=1 Tax=Prosthecobacter fluviatilis TaxID=445931 RepID=A0ABW0KRN8_9BACT
MSAWSPLRNRVFRAMWLGSVGSNIGTTMNDTAAVWTMTTMTSSPYLVSLMQTMSSLPLFLLALPAGAMADLVDRRRLILFAQAGALLTAAGMALLAWHGALTQTLLLLATFQLGVASAFTMPAWQALIPEVVGREQLPHAIALNGVGFNIARSLGPILGGLLLAALGPAPVFALNALSFIAVIGVMCTGSYIATPRSAQQEQMLGAMAAAIRYARHARAMQAVLCRGGIHMFAAVAPVVLLPVIVHSRQWSASDFGVLMGCYGGGAILMALLFLPRLRERFSFDHVLLGASVVSAAMTGILALVPGKIAMGLVLFVTGAAWISGMNTFSVASQSVFPNWVRARSSAIYLVVMQGAFAIGALTWGQLTSHLNAPVALGIAAGCLLISALLARLLPISHVEKLDLNPSNHMLPHSTLSTEPAPSDGPVLITIEYHIDPKDAPAFRAAMFHLREVRLRDGAFRCSLFADLEDPTHFRETFLVGSWAEHLRQHERATMEDQRIEQAVQSFHKGPEAPRVRHLLMVNLRDVKP